MDRPSATSPFRSEALAEQRNPKLSVEPLLGCGRWQDGALTLLVVSTLSAWALSARLSIPVTSDGTAFIGMTGDPNSLVLVFGPPATRGAGRLLAIDLGGVRLAANRLRPADRSALGLSSGPPGEHVTLLPISATEARALGVAGSRRVAAILRWQGRPLRTLVR